MATAAKPVTVNATDSANTDGENTMPVENTNQPTAQAPLSPVARALADASKYNPLTSPIVRTPAESGHERGILNCFVVEASDSFINGTDAAVGDSVTFAVDMRGFIRVYLTDDTKREANKGQHVWASAGLVVADADENATSIEWIGNGEAVTFKDGCINIIRNVGRELGSMAYALTVGDATSRSSVVARFRKEAVLAASALFDEGSAEFDQAVEKIVAKRLAAHEADKAAKAAKENADSK